MFCNETIDFPGQEICDPTPTNQSLIAIPVEGANQTQCETTCRNLIGCSHFAVGYPEPKMVDNCFVVVKDDQRNQIYTTECQIPSTCELNNIFYKINNNNNNLSIFIVSFPATK